MINGHMNGEAKSNTTPYHKWHLILSPSIAAQEPLTRLPQPRLRSVTVACFGESVCFHVGRDRQTYRTSLIEFICFWWQRVVISKTPFRLSSCCHTYECLPVTEADAEDAWAMLGWWHAWERSVGRSISIVSCDLIINVGNSSLSVLIWTSVERRRRRPGHFKSHLIWVNMCWLSFNNTLFSLINWLIGPNCMVD